MHHVANLKFIGHFLKNPFSDWSTASERFVRDRFALSTGAWLVRQSEVALDFSLTIHAVDSAVRREA